MKKLNNILYNKLKHFSQLYKIDLIYFAKNFFWNSLINLIDLIIGFVFSIVLINFLDTNSYGLWQWVLSLVGVVSIFLLNGSLDLITNKFINKKYGDFYTILKLRIVGGVIASVIIVILSIYYYFNNLPNSLVILLVLYFPLIALNISNRYFYSLDKFKTLFKISFLRIILYYGITILLLIMGVKLIFIILSFFYLQVIPDIFICFYIHKKIKQEKLQFTNKKKLALDTLKLSLSSLIPTLINNLDKLLVPIILSLKDLANYAVILLIPYTLKGIINKVYNLLFFKKYNNLDYKTLKKTTIILGLTSFVFSILLFFLIPILFKWFIPFNYYNYIIYSQILILFLPVYVISDNFSTYLRSNLKTKEVLRIDIISMGAYLVILIFLIHYFSFLGLVLSRNVFFIIKAILSGVSIKSSS